MLGTDYFNREHHSINYGEEFANISKTKIKAICLLTNRTHSINKIYNISRISLREMFAFAKEN
jgi:ribosomal protein S14